MLYVHFKELTFISSIEKPRSKGITNGDSNKRDNLLYWRVAVGYPEFLQIRNLPWIKLIITVAVWFPFLNLNVSVSQGKI